MPSDSRPNKLEQFLFRVGVAELISIVCHPFFNRDDIADAVESFIDPLDPRLLRLQEIAAILACSDKRYLPPAYRDLDRAELGAEFETLRRAFR